MSFPLQIIIATDDQRLRAKAQAVIKRLGTIGGAQVAFWIEPSDHPDFQGQLLGQIDELLSLTSGRTEGGWAQIVLASDERRLGEAADCVERADKAGVLPPRARVAIVLADRLQTAEAGRLFKAVHLVPRHLTASQLREDDRLQIACNILGLLLDLARSPAAVDAWSQWVDSHAGRWLTLAQVTRFNAPGVQHLLAQRLAGRVTAEMVAVVERGLQQEIALSPVPHAAIMKAAREESGLLGREIAERVLKTDDDRLMPRDDVLRQRIRAEADRLPERMRAFVDAHGRASMERAVKWLDALEREIDLLLELHGFAAIAPLLTELGRLEQAQRTTFEELGLHEDPGGASLSLEGLALPDNSRVRRAHEDFERELNHAERSDMLFGAWALLVAALAAGLMAPLVARAVTPLPASPTAWDVFLAEPNTFFMLAGLVALIVAGILSAIQDLKARKRLHGLQVAFKEAMDAYKEDWADKLGDHIRHVGVTLQRRMIRFALDGIERESRRLGAVAATLRHLSVRYDANPPAPQGTHAAFDADLVLSADFYRDAQGIVATEELLSRFDEAMRSGRWRRELEFMDSEAILHLSKALYGAFSEQIPFETHMQLRRDVAEPTRQCIERMEADLARYLPRAEHGVQRSLVMPESLRGEAPRELPAALARYHGVSDVFVAAARIDEGGG